MIFRWSAIAAALVAVLAVQWPVWLSLSKRWSHGEGYTHGYLVVAIAIYLVYRSWPQLRAVPAAPSWLGLALLVPTAVVAFAGEAVQVQALQFLALPATLWLWAVAAFGWRVGALLLVPVGVLYYAVPLWDMFTDPLRELTVLVTQSFLDLFRIPAYIDGFYIQVPVGTFLVAGGCSGLNSLVIALLVGTLQAYLAPVEWWRRALMVIIAAALGLASNWLRVTALVIIGYHTEMRSELVADHVAFGWWVFAGALAIFFAVSLWLERGGINRAPAPHVPRPSARKMPARAAWFAAAAALVVVLLPGWSMLRAEVAADAPARGLAAPAAWSAIEAGGLPDYRGYDLSQSWQLDVEGRRFELLALTYWQQAQGKELIYYANRMADEDHTLQAGVLPLANGVRVNRELIRTGAGPRIVWWYYLIDGEAASSDWQGKLLQLKAALKGDRRAALVALSSPCRAADCQGDAELSPALQQLLVDWPAIAG